MLFLAVFCGFLAEYQLEHTIEKDREKQYIISMIEDLSADTSKLNVVIKQFSESDLQLDTVLRMYSSLVKGFNFILRRNISVVLGFPEFTQTERTLQQLKNSGGMRLLRSKQAANGISEYDSEVTSLAIEVSVLADLRLGLQNSWNKIFDEESLWRDLEEMSIEQIEKGNKNYLFFSDRAILGEFNNQIRAYKSSSEFIRELEKKLRDHAVRLIRLLKKEYHLK